MINKQAEKQTVGQMDEHRFGSIETLKGIQLVCQAFLLLFFVSYLKKKKQSGLLRHTASGLGFEITHKTEVTMCFHERAQTRR